MWTPQTEFYFLLTQGPMHRNWKLLGLIPVHQTLNPDNFVPFEMRIDWVRAYARCETLADFCPQSGTFDARTGTCTNRGGAYRTPCAPRAFR